ncbi:MAG TPA: ribonuclease III [Caulobacteraceae bacterium]|nr:ribonuclease III [Caulobacteraceae bacterium]
MDRRAAAIAALEAQLGHVFADRSLIERALTHSSAGQGAKKPPDNERLEFLGDRVLALVIAGELMARDETADAGDLSKRLHVLVAGQACARVGRDLGLGPALRLPGGETRRGAREQDTILADACEAIIAALYVELGLERAGEIVLRLWAPILDEPLDEALTNPKSELQEWAATIGRPPPAYRLISRSGPDHRPLFTMEAEVEGLPPVAASGGSRQAAEKAAALALLLRERGTG